MEENRDYITVKELAEIQGVSVQSIYQRFNTTLKPYIKVIKGKKCLDIKVLEEVYHLDIKDFKQGFKQDIKGTREKPEYHKYVVNTGEKDITLFSINEYDVENEFVYKDIEGSQVELVPCEKCGRKLAADRLEAHKRACKGRK